MKEVQNALLAFAKCSWISTYKQFVLLSEEEEELMPDEQEDGYYAVLSIRDESGISYIGRVRCSDNGYTFVSVETLENK